MYLRGWAKEGKFRGLSEKQAGFVKCEALTNDVEVDSGSRPSSIFVLFFGGVERVYRKIVEN